MIFGMDIEFNADHSDSIIKHCQDRGMDEMESWLHLLTAAVSLCPKKEMSHITLDLIYDSEAVAASEGGLHESKITRNTTDE